MTFDDEILSIQEARLLNPLVLAFVGDAVETLYVRRKLAMHSDAKANRLHTLATREINATAQSRAVESIMDMLTEEESDIYRRARNSKVSTPAKHATLDDYKKASGFEAVLGYLYLTGRSKRIKELMEAAERPL